jgi:hypothetical protein
MYGSDGKCPCVTVSHLPRSAIQLYVSVKSEVIGVAELPRFEEFVSTPVTELLVGLEVLEVCIFLIMQL